MQSNAAGTLDFNSNDCLVDLKPLCMRETGSGITVSDNQRWRWRKAAKKKETLARQKRNRWRKRTRDKLKRSIGIGGRGEQRVDPKCGLWKDLILPGDIYLGKRECEDNLLLFFGKDKFALKPLDLFLLRKRGGFVRLMYWTKDFELSDDMSFRMSWEVHCWI